MAEASPALKEAGMKERLRREVWWVEGRELKAAVRRCVMVLVGTLDGELLASAACNSLSVWYVGVCAILLVPEPRRKAHRRTLLSCIEDAQPLAPFTLVLLTNLL